MELLQNIKGFLARYFPLHLNSTVEALEDDLADAELELYFIKAREWCLREEVEVLRETNKELARDNRYLNSNLEQARQCIRALQHELEEVYSSMTPKLSSWPMPVSAQLDDTSPFGSFIRVELPALRLQCLVNEAVRRGMFPGYVDAFADRIASTAHKEVKAAVADILNNLPPVKK